MCPRQIGDNINDEQYKSASLFSVIKFIEFKNQPQYTQADMCSGFTRNFIVIVMVVGPLTRMSMAASKLEYQS